MNTRIITNTLATVASAATLAATSLIQIASVAIASAPSTTAAQSAGTETLFYVDPVTGSDANDGLSSGAPFQTIVHALEYARTNYFANGGRQVVNMAAGTYAWPSQANAAGGYGYQFNFPVTFDGTSGGGADAVIWDLSSCKSTRKPVFTMTNSAVRVEIRNVTIRNKPAAGPLSFVIKMVAGVLDGCCVSNNVSGFDYDEQQGNINMAGGLITNCVIACNRVSSTNAKKSYGGGIYMTGGLVTDCRIFGNSSEGVVEGAGGGVGMSGGTLRNSLVVGNAACNTGSGIYINPSSRAVVENCTVAGNSAMTGTAANVYGLYAGGSSAAKSSCIINTIIRDNSGIAAGQEGALNLARVAAYSYASNNLVSEAIADGATASGNIVAEANFKDAAGGDYRISYGPAVDAGLTLAWMEGAHDLAGTSRVLGAEPDIGAYEYVPDGALSATFGVSQATLVLGSSVVLTAYAGGGTGPYTYAWAVDGVTAGDGVTATVSPSVVGWHEVSLTVTDAAAATATKTLSNVFFVATDHVYVSPDGSNTSPYDSWQTAATSFADVLPLLADGATVEVAAGTYDIAAPMALTKRATVVGAGPGKTILRPATGIGVFTIAGSNTVISGFTVTGCTARVFELAAYATISNVVACDGNSGTDYALLHTTAGVWVKDLDCFAFTNTARNLVYAEVAGNTLLENCEFDRCAALSANNPLFESYTRPMTLRNVKVTNCKAGANLVSIRSDANNAIIENCLFYDCIARGAALSTPFSGNTMTIRNTIVGHIYNSSGVEQLAGSSAGIYSYSNLGYTNGMWSSTVKLGAGVISADPRFRAPARGNYRLQSASPCYNTGTNLPWMATAIDLDDVPRIRHGTVDMGPYETAMEGLNIFIR